MTENKKYLYIHEASSCVHNMYRFLLIYGNIGPCWKCPILHLMLVRLNILRLILQIILLMNLAMAGFLGRVTFIYIYIFSLGPALRSIRVMVLMCLSVCLFACLLASLSHPIYFIMMDVLLGQYTSDPKYFYKFRTPYKILGRGAEYRCPQPHHPPLWGGTLWGGQGRHE